MSAEYPCQAQAGVCRYDDSDSRGSPLSLGLMRSRPTGRLGLNDFTKLSR